MEIYTSYFAMQNKLVRAGIEPVAICRGKPKWFNGRSVDELAPTWQMMKMPLDEFWDSYERMLAKKSASEIASKVWSGKRSGFRAVALMCYEKNQEECHRSVVAKWMRGNGIEVNEWGKDSEKKEPECLQLSLF